MRRVGSRYSLKAAQFSKAADFFFKPLNEHVADYQQPFRIVQDVAIDPSPQACDNTVCFIPQSVPLTWTVSLQPLDRERSKAR